MATAQEVDLLRRQLEELNGRMEEVRQQSANAAMNAAVTGLTDAVRTKGQSVSKPHPEDLRVGKPEPYVLGKGFDDWDFAFNGYAGNTRSCLSSPAESSETVSDSGDGDNTTRTAVCNIAVPSHDAHTKKTTKSREESWKQRIRSFLKTVVDVRNLRPGGKRRTLRANHDVQVRIQNRRRGRPSQRISAAGKTIR